MWCGQTMQQCGQPVPPFSAPYVQLPGDLMTHYSATHRSVLTLSKVLKSFLPKMTPCTPLRLRTGQRIRQLSEDTFFKLHQDWKKSLIHWLNKKEREFSTLLTQHKDNPNLDLRGKIDLVRLKLNLCLMTRVEKSLRWTQAKLYS